MGSFEALYQLHVNAVFRYCVHLVGHRDVAEDITSEAFLELYRNLDRIEAERLPAWLFTVAKRRAVDYWRKNMTEQRYATSTPDADPPQAAQEQLPIESLLVSSKLLKPIHRACLILRYFHGMSRDEIARQLGLSETQIKGHLQYSLQVLRKELGVQQAERSA